MFFDIINIFNDKERGNLKEFYIKANDYFEYKRPNYTFLKLTPSNSIRNYNSDKFITLVAGLYKTIDKQIRTVNKKLFFECNAKISYYIYMEKSDVQFYFIVPDSHYNLFKDKIIDTWSNKITITKVEEIPLFNQQCTKYCMTYKQDDALSLTTDKRNNVLLNSLLTTLHIMEDGDKVGVFYNFSPTIQKTWRSNYDRTIQKLKEDLPIGKNKTSIAYLFRVGLIFLSKAMDIVVDSISLSTSKPTEKRLRDIILSDDTGRKRDSTIVNAQILCLSESDDKDREYNNAISVCNSFECLDADNRLISRKLNGEVDLFATRIKGAEIIKIQPREGQNFISLPGKELLEEYKGIEHTNILETKVPEKLQHGYISVGYSTYKGNATEAFMRDNYDQGNFPVVLIGEQGSGKTTYISNYTKYIQSRNEGCIVLDFIKNCELAYTIEKSTPKDKLIILDMSDIYSAQGFGYNELQPKSQSYIDLLDISNRKSLYVQMLIDALNTDGEPLSTSMDRFLSSASNIVFLDSHASLKDVVKCLNDWEYREEYINRVPLTIKDMLIDEISALKELNEYDKDGVKIIGTRTAKVDGINHRINLLKKDLRLKMMFNQNCSDNLDLVKAMDDGKIILIKMPQEYFATPYSKNVIVTYWLTKIWCATLIRGSRQKEPKRFHVIVDEIFQAKTAMQMLRDQETLPQTRKFGCKFVISCQSLGQINTIDQTLRSAGASYMLMKGSGKSNFQEFKEELYPFTLDDMEALPQYHSLNIINYEDGRAKFITRLPKPL
jgi:hypothetical protein